MKPSTRILLYGTASAAACVFVGLAPAQPMPPQAPAWPAAGPVPLTRGSAYEGQQLPETRGTVQRFTLTPIGELDGFLLADGTQVHLPPHLSTELAAAVRPGDSVSVRGYRSPSAPLVVAAEVLDTATNRTIIDQGPPPPGSRPPPPPPGAPAPGAQQTSVNGQIRMPLYGPGGDVNGALLEDGTILRLPPPEAARSAGLLVPGQTITTQGFALGTAYGRVIDAQTVERAPAATPAYPAPPRPPGL